MEPITVTCSTCQSRIRVRNPDLIGQIVNCPKCQSMIMVVDPSKVVVKPQSNATIDSMSVTKDDLPPISTDGNRIHAEEGHTADVNNSLLDEEYRLAPAEATAAPIRLEPTTPPPWSAEPVPLMPDDGWTTARTVKQRQMLMIILGGVGSVVVSIALLAVFLQSSKEKTKPNLVAASEQGDAPTNDAVAAPSDDPVQAASRLPEDTATSQAPDSPVADERLSSIDNAPGLNEPSVQSPDVQASENTTIDARIRNDPSAVPIPDPTLPIDLTAGDANTNLNRPGNEPDNASEVASGGSSDQPNAGPALAGSDDVPKLLVDFAPMLDWRIQPVLPDTEAIPTNAPLTAEELGVSATGPDPAEAIPSIQQELTSRKLAGIAIKNRPFWHVVNTWTNLTGIPTTVALDQLALAGIDRNTRVSLQSGNMQDVWSLATELAATMGLNATVRDDQYLELSVAPEELKASIPLAVRLPSTVDEAAMQTWLTEQLSTLFPQGMPSLSISAGEIRVAADEVGDKEWLDIIRIIDQWRVSLGEESQFGGDRSEMWTALWNPDPDVPVLDKVCDTLTTQPQGLGILLSRVCSEADLACWMDWPNLGSIGIMPQTTRLYVTNARPLRNILKDFATETSAIVAVLDSQSVWITSPNGYRKQPKSFIAPLGDRSIEDWTRELRVFTPLDENNNQFLPIIKTPDEKFIVFRCCLPVAEL